VATWSFVAGRRALELGLLLLIELVHPRGEEGAILIEDRFFLLGLLLRSSLVVRFHQGQQALGWVLVEELMGHRD